jgi:hypothetical protein
MVSHNSLLPNYQTCFWYHIRPIVGKKPQVIWTGNTHPSTKKFWRTFNFVFQRHSFMWQILIVGLMFAVQHVCYDPLKFIYMVNNEKRTYKVAFEKEKAYKKMKKLK